MIVVMKANAKQESIDHMVEKIEGMGLKAHVIVGTERTVIAAIGDDRKENKESTNLWATTNCHSRKPSRDA